MKRRTRKPSSQKTPPPTPNLRPRLWEPVPKSAAIVARLPVILETLDRASQQLRLAIGAAGGNVANADLAALAGWTYAVGLATGWIMQGGAIMATEPVLK